MLKLRLTLDVTYNDNGVSEQELRENLKAMVQHAMGDGWITGESEAEVEESALRIEKVT